MITTQLTYDLFFYSDVVLCPVDDYNSVELGYDLFFYSDMVLSKFRQSVMDNPTFMETSRGGRYMFLDDFQYLQNRKSTTTTVWRCRNRRTYEAQLRLPTKMMKS